MPTKNTATIVSTIMTFRVKPFSGGRELKSPNCFSKSSQSHLFILKSPLGFTNLIFDEVFPYSVSAGRCAVYCSPMGYNARNDEIRDNVTRMQRDFQAQWEAP